MNYTSDIKIFQVSPDLPAGTDFLSAPDYPANRVVPGYLCQAGRLVAGLTQQELHVLADVSKKTINDYENGLITVRVGLAERLATALRTTGVRFIAGEGYVGAIVRGRRKPTDRQVVRSGRNDAAPNEVAPTVSANLPDTRQPRSLRRAKRDL